MPVICSGSFPSIGEVVLVLVVITTVGAILVYHSWSLVFYAPTYIRTILEREAEKRKKEEGDE